MTKISFRWGIGPAGPSKRIKGERTSGEMGWVEVGKRCVSHLTRQEIPKGRWECAEVGKVDCSLERPWVPTHRLDARMRETASGSQQSPRLSLFSSLIVLLLVKRSLYRSLFILFVSYQVNADSPKLEAAQMSINQRIIRHTVNSYVVWQEMSYWCNENHEGLFKRIPA